MTKRLNRFLIVWTAVLATLLLSIMIGYCYQRGGSDEIDAEADLMQSDMQTVVADMGEIYDESQSDSKYLYIPLASGITADDVEVKNDYINKVLEISVKGIPERYFFEHKLSGCKENIEKIAYSSNTEITTLYLYCNGIYEYEETFENNALCIKLVVPRELHSKIIVIDPGHGGSESGQIAEQLAEKDLCLDIAMRLKKLLEKTDIQPYFTRLEDDNTTMDQIISLVNETRADLFLSIHAANEVADTSIYGITTYYNESFFIPSFSSADFAYLVEEKVTKATKSKRLGLKPGDEDMYLVRNAEVPVALVEIGYLSNKQEQILLSKDDYRDKIAKGLYEAIIASYEEMNESDK